MSNRQVHFVTTSDQHLRSRVGAALGAFLVSSALLLSLASTASAVPSDFVGLMWGTGAEGSGPEMEAISRSGAKILRYQLDWYVEAIRKITNPGEEWAPYDAVFQRAWEHGIAIQPYIYGNLNGSEQFPSKAEWEPQGSGWETWLYELVQRYGQGGSFWAGKANPKPVVAWEIWNEPNLTRNNPGGAGVYPHAYGEFLERSSQAIHAAQAALNGTTPYILMGGLASVGHGPEGNMPVKQFVEEAGAAGSYDGLSLHPYAFKANDGSAPENNAEVIQVKEKVKTNIEQARNGLNNTSGSGKGIWITELGWPIEVGDAAHPAVPNESIQAELLGYSFNMIKAQYTNLGIWHVYWYNDRDNGAGGWDYHTGLRKSAAHIYTEPNFRLVWTAFREQTGAGTWPVPATTQTQSGTLYGYTQPRKATLNGSVNPHGLPTNYHFDWGTNTGYGNSTGTQNQWEDKSFSHSETLTGLTPNTTYHYRLASTNENAESANGSDVEFTTPHARPIVESESYSNIRVEKETGKIDLKGTVNPNGFSTHYHFEWGTQAEYEAGEYNHRIPAEEDATIGSGIGGEAVEQTVAGIKGLTTYHYRIVAENSEGTTTADDHSFTTPDWRPNVSPKPADHIEVVEEQGRATLHGTINPNGFKAHYRYEWGTQAEYELGEYNHHAPETDADAGSGESAVSVPQTINVKGEITYHYRLVAENVEGKSPNEEVLSFTTPDWRPKLWTVNAGRVEGHEATFEARIDPEGFDTHYRFEWGTQAEYEEGKYANSLPVDAEDLGNGQSYLERTYSLEGLRTHSTYHFRAVAESAEGTSIYGGPEAKFTTWAASIASTAPATVEVPDSWFILEFPNNGEAAECGHPDLEGSLVGSAQELALAPSGSPSCAWVSGEAPFEMNGCSFELNPGAPGEGANDEIEIGPPGCGPIETSSLNGCRISIPSQIGVPATFQDVGEGDEEKLRIDLGKEDGVGFAKGAPCTPESRHEDGVIRTSYEDWEAHGEGPEGEAVGVHLRYPLDGEADAATDVGATEATLHATLYPAGSAAIYTFQYGTSEEYESQTPLRHLEAGAESPLEVEETIEGLQPETIYHFMFGAGGGGIVLGEDLTFTTRPACKNGTSQCEWSLQPTPDPELPVPPEPVNQSELGAVSCPSAELCLATGYDGNFSRAFGQVWDGAEWQAGKYLDRLPGDPQGLACPTQEECLAVGHDGTAASVELWGDFPSLGWYPLEELQLPAIEGAEATLSDVSCPSEEACTAVGHYTAEGTTRPLALRLAREEPWLWSATLQSAAAPESGAAELSDVSCPSASSCTAVGSHEGQTFAEAWDGSAWSISATPDPEGAESSSLESVSCSSAGACTAVGSYTYEALTEEQEEQLEEWGVSEEELREMGLLAEVKRTLILRFNGSSWSIQGAPTPSPDLNWAQLRDVSCASASSCVAVGSYATQREEALGANQAPTEEKTLAMGWDGSEWAVQESPNPEGRPFSQLTSVACPSQVACEAAGWGLKKVSGQWDRVTVGEGSSEGEWSLQPTPDPELPVPPEPVNQSELGAVSCPSAELCLATGYDGNFSRAFGQVWDGAEWQAGKYLDRLPGDPQGLACPTQEECLAVGHDGTAASVELWGDFPSLGWYPLEELQLPAIEGAEATLSDVSCPSEEACTAVGHYTAEGTTRPLALRLAREEPWLWSATLQSAAAPESGAAELSDVSCPSASSCTAVGSHEGQTFAEAWDGSAWSISATPDPEGAESSSLESVSCSSAGACTAVGSYTYEALTEEQEEQLEEWGVSEEELREMGLLAEVKRTLILRFNGSSWSIQGAPTPSPDLNWAQLRDVSCASASSCVAVGSYATQREEALGANQAPTEEKTLAMGWDGSEWAVQESPNPEGRPFSQLTSVACPSQVACEAAGWGLKKVSGQWDRVTVGERYE